MSGHSYHIEHIKTIQTQSLRPDPSCYFSAFKPHNKASDYRHIAANKMRVYCLTNDSEKSKKMKKHGLYHNGTNARRKMPDGAYHEGQILQHNLPR
jgi:hypothetical protein